MPAWTTNNTSTEFSAGVSHLGNPGRANAAPVGPVAYDTGFQAVEREQGGYQPGQFESMEDELSQGADDA
jgi:hypothetical protein